MRPIKVATTLGGVASALPIVLLLPDVVLPVDVLEGSGVQIGVVVDAHVLQLARADALVLVLEGVHVES